MAYFNEQKMPSAHNEYVLWIDIMGTKNKMMESVRTSAIFMYKLHVTILENSTEDIVLYPIMDGVYVTSKNQKTIKLFMIKVFSSLGKDFFSQENISFRFLVKGALAYGPIIHGEEVSPDASRIFKDKIQYKNSILIGLPMIQAFNSEKLAPPFGVYVHESARAFAPEGESPFVHKWWKWFLEDQRIWNKEKSEKLNKCINEYFDHAKQQTITLDYPLDKIDIHKRMFAEYGTF